MKHFLLALLVVLNAGAAELEMINLTSPSGKGDTLPVGGAKINSNTVELASRILGVSNNVAGLQFTVTVNGQSTTNYINTRTAFVSTSSPITSNKVLRVYGDSIAFGKWSAYPDIVSLDTNNVATWTNNYPARFASYFGLAKTNYSYPGFCLVDQQSNVFSSVVDSSYLSIWALGANDNRNVNTASSYYQPMQLGHLLWLSIPQVAKITGRQTLTNTSCFTTNMAGDAVAYMPGVYSFNPSAVIVSNLVGTNIAIGLNLGTNTTFTTNIGFYVDGVLVTNLIVQVNPFPSQYGYDRIYGEAGFLIKGLANSVHTIMVTNGGGSLWTFEWISASSSWTNLQPVLVEETTYQSTNYAWGGSQAGVDALNTATRSNVLLAQSAGFPIYHVLLNSMELNSHLVDGIHQDSIGHGIMASNTISSVLTNLGTVTITVNGSYLASGSVAITALDPATQALISPSAVPANASATGTPGWFSYDTNYFYICVGTNKWQRVSTSTW